MLEEPEQQAHKASHY